MSVCSRVKLSKVFAACGAGLTPVLAAALLMDLLQSILDWVIFLFVSAVQTV
jgi:hypothetical protein